MIQPRPYQRQAVDCIFKELQSLNNHSTIVVLPTGMGKTVVASLTISEYKGGNILFLAHTKELIEQSAARIERDTGFKPFVEMNVQGADPGGLWQGDMVVVGSVQSMVSDRRLEKYRNYPFDLIIVDECHHATSSTYRKVIDFFHKINPNLKVMGITATPKRTDNTALGLLFQSVAYQMDIGQAIDEGWLVPFKQLTVTVEGLRLNELKVKRNKLGDKDFNDRDIEQQLIEERNLHEMATPILRELGQRQAIIFTAGVKHAHLLSNVLNDHRKGCCEAIDGETDTNDRKNIIKAFRNNELQFLTNCAVLTEGFDAPACSAVVMARPTKSSTLYTQCVGRGLRPLPGVVDGLHTQFDRKTAIFTSDKQDCIVLDFVGASSVGTVDCYDVLGGNYDAEVRELARGEKKSDKPEPVSIEDLELAKTVLELRKQLARRAAILVESQYQLEEADARMGRTSGMVSTARGTITDGQLNLLVKLGVHRDTAIKYSKRQAGAVIDNLGQKRCTSGQAYVLKKHGLNPAHFNLKTAGEMINELKGVRQ